MLVQTQVQKVREVSDAPSVNRVEGQKSKSARPGGSSARGCYRCGAKHHPARCPFREYECHHCKKKGHLAKVCRKKQAASMRTQNQPEQANVVNNVRAESKEEYQMYHVRSPSSRPLQVTITANGKPLLMEVDTGVSVSIVSEETYNFLREGQSSLELQRSSVRLQTYTGEPIAVVGSIEVPVEHKGQLVSLPLIVTQGSGPTLLGRNWLSTLELDWHTIFSVQTSRTLQELLEEKEEVFRTGLGTLEGVTAKIYVDPDVQPRYHKPRTVPFALRKKVDEELERLQTLGVIYPVQFSDWAAPIVPVLKGDGRVRICGDYKVTINSAAKQDKYPLPRIDELFASLAGGKSFSKLDLSHAYLQVQLDEPSQKHVTINTQKGLFRYSRLPFGVSSAPSIFQRVMENHLQGIPGVCVYINDILVTGSTQQEHLGNLAQVLDRLGSAGMRLNMLSYSHSSHIWVMSSLHRVYTRRTQK